MKERQMKRTGYVFDGVHLPTYTNRYRKFRSMKMREKREGKRRGGTGTDVYRYLIKRHVVGKTQRKAAGRRALLLINYCSAADGFCTVPYLVHRNYSTTWYVPYQVLYVPKEKYQNLLCY